MINKVLNVLTLVAAVVVLIGAYMLFEKRTLLLKRGDVLAKEVEAVAASLDQGSGTKVADKLKVADLNHKKFGDETELGKLAPKVAALSEQAKAIIAQRDALAGVVADAAVKLKIEGVDAANLQNVASSAEETAKMAEAVVKVKERDELLVSSISSVAEAAGAEINAGSLASFDKDQVKNEMTGLQGAVTDTVERKKAFADHIGQVAQILGIQAPSVDGEGYADELSTTVGNVTEVKNTLEDAKTKLASTKKSLEEREAEVAEAEESIVSLKAKIKLQEEKVAELEGIVKEQMGNVTAEETKAMLEEIKTLGDNYYETLKLVRGRIIKINEKWGFAVVNVGAKTKVPLSVGNFVREMDAALPEGKIMDISRSVNGSQEFVAQFQITEVHDDYAVGNIIAKNDSFVTAVGDDVYFSNETVAAMKLEEEKEVEAQKKEIIKKAEEKKVEVKKAAGDTFKVVEDNVAGDGKKEESEKKDDLDDLDDLDL